VVYRGTEPISVFIWRKRFASKGLLMIATGFVAMGLLSCSIDSEEEAVYQHRVTERMDYHWREVYAPRHPDQVCPPEYPRNRERLERYLNSPSVDFKGRFGAAAPRSAAEIEVLTDEADSEACRYFNDRFDERINTKVRLKGNDSPQYWYDVSFFKAGEFYFVISNGGNVGWEEEDVSMFRHSSFDSSLLPYRKETFEFVEPYVIEPLP